MTKTAPLPSKLRLTLAVRHVRQGGLLAYPTESVWGLGCDPLNGEAVNHLLRLKGRSASKGLILIASDFWQLAPFLQIGSQQMESRMRETWPGPVTWVVPCTPDTPAWLRGGRDTLAVRVTAHPVAAALCQACRGALVSTSANPSGLPPARTLMQTKLYFAAENLHYLPGQIGGLDKPTAIYDARSGVKLR